MMGITLIVCLLAVTSSEQALTDVVINCPEICKSIVYRRFKSLLAKCDCSMENENYFRYEQLEDSGIYFEPTDLYTLQRLSFGPPFYILNPALKYDFAAPKNIKKRRHSHYNKPEDKLKYKNKKSSSNATKPTEERKRSLYLDIDVQDELEIERTATHKYPFELSEKDFKDCVNIYTLIYTKSKEKNIANIPNIKGIKYSGKDTLTESKQLVDIIREKCSQPADVVRQSLRQITNTWQHPQISTSESSDLFHVNVESSDEKEVETNGMYYRLNISDYQNYKDELSQEVAILSDKNNKEFSAYSEKSTVESEESFTTEIDYAVDHPIKKTNISHKHIFMKDTSAKEDTINNQYPLNSTNISNVLAEKGIQPEFYKYSDRSGNESSLVAYKNETDKIAVQSNSSRTNRKYESDVNNSEHINENKTSDESEVIKYFTVDILEITNNNTYNSHNTEYITEITSTNSYSDLLDIEPKYHEKEYYTTNKYNLKDYYDKQTVIASEFAEISTQLPENTTVNKNNYSDYYDKQTTIAKISELTEISTQLPENTTVNKNNYSDYYDKQTTIAKISELTEISTQLPENTTVKKNNYSDYYDKQTTIANISELTEISTQLPENTTVKKNNYSDYYDKQTTIANISEFTDISTQLPEKISKTVSTLETPYKVTKNDVDITRISSDELHSAIILDSDKSKPKFLLQYSNEIPTEVVSSAQNETRHYNSSALSISYNPELLETTIALNQALSDATKSSEYFAENNKNKSTVTRSTATTSSDFDYIFASTRNDNDSVTPFLTYPVIYRHNSNSLSPSADALVTTDRVNGGYNQINLKKQESEDLLIATTLIKDNKYTKFPLLTDEEKTITTDYYQQENNKFSEENTTGMNLLDNSNNNLIVDKYKPKYIETDYNKLNSITTSGIDMEEYVTRKTIQSHKNGNSSESVLTSTTETDVHNLVNITATETEKIEYDKTGIIKDKVNHKAHKTDSTNYYKDVVSDLDDINIYSNNFTEGNGSYQILINNYFPHRNSKNMGQKIEYTANNYTENKNHNSSLKKTGNMNQQIDGNASVKGNLFFIFNKTNVPAKFLQQDNGELSIGVDGATLCEKLNTDHSQSFLINVICNCFLYSNCTSSML